MWYQAVAGGLVMAGAYGFGMALCQDMRCLLYHLEEQKRMLLYFERETDFLHRPIQESFDSIADRLSTPYCELVTGVARAMKNADGKAFGEIWNQKTNELMNKRCYPEKAMEYLRRIGEGIGSEEDTLQIELCALLRKELEEEADRLKRDRAQKSRVINTMSLAGGILCVVMFL